MSIAMRMLYREESYRSHHGRVGPSLLGNTTTMPQKPSSSSSTPSYYPPIAGPTQPVDVASTSYYPPVAGPSPATAAKHRHGDKPIANSSINNSFFGSPAAPSSPPQQHLPIPALARTPTATPVGGDSYYGIKNRDAEEQAFVKSAAIPGPAQSGVDEMSFTLWNKASLDTVGSFLPPPQALSQAELLPMRPAQQQQKPWGPAAPAAAAALGPHSPQGGGGGGLAPAAPTQLLQPPPPPPPPLGLEQQQQRFGPGAVPPVGRVSSSSSSSSSASTPVFALAPPPGHPRAGGGEEFSASSAGASGGRGMMSFPEPPVVSRRTHSHSSYGRAGGGGRGEPQQQQQEEEEEEEEKEVVAEFSRGRQGVFGSGSGGGQGGVRRTGGGAAARHSRTASDVPVSSLPWRRPATAAAAEEPHAPFSYAPAPSPFWKEGATHGGWDGNGYSSSSSAAAAAAAEAGSKAQGNNDEDDGNASSGAGSQLVSQHQQQQQRMERASARTPLHVRRHSHSSDADLGSSVAEGGPADAAGPTGDVVRLGEGVGEDGRGGGVVWGGGAGGRGGVRASSLGGGSGGPGHGRSYSQLSSCGARLAEVILAKVNGEEEEEEGAWSEGSSSFSGSAAAEERFVRAGPLVAPPLAMANPAMALRVDSLGSSVMDEEEEDDPAAAAARGARRRDRDMIRKQRLEKQAQLLKSGDWEAALAVAGVGPSALVQQQDPEKRRPGVGMGMGMPENNKQGALLGRPRPLGPGGVDGGEDSSSSKSQQGKVGIVVPSMDVPPPAAALASGGVSSWSSGTEAADKWGGRNSLEGRSAKNGVPPSSDRPSSGLGIKPQPLAAAVAAASSSGRQLPPAAASTDPSPPPPPPPSSQGGGGGGYINPASFPPDLQSLIESGASEISMVFNRARANKASNAPRIHVPAFKDAIASKPLTTLAEDDAPSPSNSSSSSNSLRQPGAASPGSSNRSNSSDKKLFKKWFNIGR